jgi:hypothetical protein
MTPRHLGCPGCRIRVFANAPEIDLLEGSCPICGASLRPVSSARDVMGFRWFDLDAFSDARLTGASGVQLDEGGSFHSEAAEWRAPRRPLRATGSRSQSSRFDGPSIAADPGLS